MPNPNCVIIGRQNVSKKAIYSLETEAIWLQVDPEDHELVIIARARKALVEHDGEPYVHERLFTEADPEFEAMFDQLRAQARDAVKNRPPPEHA